MEPIKNFRTDSGFKVSYQPTEIWEIDTLPKVQVPMTLFTQLPNKGPNLKYEVWILLSFSNIEGYGFGRQVWT